LEEEKDFKRGVSRIELLVQNKFHKSTKSWNGRKKKKQAARREKDIRYGVKKRKPKT